MPTTGVTIYADDDLVESFDDKVWELKNSEKIDRDASRSEVLRGLMEAWVEGKSTTPKPEIQTAD